MINADKILLKYKIYRQIEYISYLLRHRRFYSFSGTTIKSELFYLKNYDSV